jgi:hypothetical protein
MIVTKGFDSPSHDNSLPPHHDSYFFSVSDKQTDALTVLIRDKFESGLEKDVRGSQSTVVGTLENNAA